ncbi:MAG TPA: bifunctional hydroxymethylpyrimidine kinase/phosphomethylpyrimidine kinase [Polyangiaceae bacterium]|nr:bifunctional hydroxymethylpyrimidine kinase/phosphomethylpyrimidine kinase [Polyangiaceae bacterium]
MAAKKTKEEPEREAPVRVLVIAGSDASGGAGIQADIKTVMALGGYAMTAITALTAQNTRGVQGISEVDPFFVEQQVQSVLDDIGADAVKIGMLASPQTAELVARQLESRARGMPVVLDPVLASSSGASLYPPQGIKTLLQRLVPQSALVTPNIAEAQTLTGVTIRDVQGMQSAADRLLLLGASAVLIKGSHLEGDLIVDLLRTADGLERRFEGPRIVSRSTHGTGCTLASAIATYLGHGFTLESAVAQAHDYVTEAIRRAVPLGKGHGPLDHAWPRYHKAEN